MSATDELRRMLDERGVEWGNVRNDGYESDYLTKWQINGIQGHAFVTVTEWPGGLTLETFQRCPTPEQAIAATLGNGTCKVESSVAIEFDTLISPDYFEFEMSCGSRFRWSDNEPPDYCPGCGRKVVHDGS